MKWTSKIIAIALFALLPGLALAVPATIEWGLPTEDYCSGEPMAEVLEMEIYISTTPIPASDVACPGLVSSVEAPPADFDQRIDAGDQDGSVTVELEGGNTYYVRARLRTAVGWSNLSNEATDEVPADDPSAPPPPVIIRLGI